MNLALFATATTSDATLKMSSLEIADLVKSRHDDVKRSIERLTNKGAIVQPPTADEHSTDSMGRSRTTQVYIFSGHQGRLDSITVVAQLDPLFTAALVKRWDDLETGKTQPALAPQTTPAPAIAHTPLTHDIAALELAARVLNVSESGKLGMVRHAFQHHAPHLLPALPGYAVDAPRDVVVACGSSMVTASATSLLKKHGISTSPAKFNERLCEYGLLVQAQRQGKGGTFKKFWRVTPSGESYGKNITSPVNQRETQPHWYVDRFSTLLAGVGLA